MAHIAHLILAHRSPGAVARLVRALEHENSVVFIHIDQKEDITPFVDKTHQLSNTRFITKRTDITWGAYSMVQATLDAIHEILSGTQGYDFINILSETDYPLKHMQEFHRFLADHIGKSFVEMHFYRSPWWQEAQEKIQKYHLADYKFLGKYLAERLINQVSQKRKLPLDMVFTGRSQWMTLSVPHIRHIFSQINKYPEITRFFKHTWGPDEFFFQTILYNSPHRAHLVNDNLRYIDWSEGKMSPKTLSLDDFESLKQSGKFFARKFEYGSAVLDHIDRYLIDV